MAGDSWLRAKGSRDNFTSAYLHTLLRKVCDLTEPVPPGLLAFILARVAWTFAGEPKITIRRRSSSSSVASVSLSDESADEDDDSFLDYDKYLSMVRAHRQPCIAIYPPAQGERLGRRATFSIKVIAPAQSTLTDFFATPSPPAKRPTPAPGKHDAAEVAIQDVRGGDDYDDGNGDDEGGLLDEHEGEEEEEEEEEEAQEAEEEVKAMKRTNDAKRKAKARKDHEDAKSRRCDEGETQGNSIYLELCPLISSHSFLDWHPYYIYSTW